MNWIKRHKVWSVFIVVALVVAGAAGAASTPNKTTTTAPIITQAPTTTPTAIVAITPAAVSNKPKATPAPVIVITPEPVSDTNWIAFAKHLAAGTYVDALDQFNSVLQSNPTAAQYHQAAVVFVTKSHTEIAWLKANPPSPCYESVYVNYYNSVVDSNNAAIDLDNGDFDTAITELNNAVDEIPTVDDVNLANALCTGN
jgi:hypothetical protein